MAVSQEEERYKQFESLRERFKVPAASPKTAPTLRDRSRPGSTVKKRTASYDHRSNAPPLMPLVEEGDQIQQELCNPIDERLQKLATPKSSAVKGKWKYNMGIKSNHLNGSDYDALETASMTSCSSAYSSKSESSTFSPFGSGSITELSEVGSCDTFLEYDTPRHTRTNSDEVTSEIVPKNAHVWDKVIGQWVFTGVTQQSSPRQPRMRRPSNEVRLPTPLSTPLGSTDNLLASVDSSLSLLSFPDSMDSDDYTPQPSQPHTPHTPISYKLGRFVRSESSLTTSILSTPPPTPLAADNNSTPIGPSYIKVSVKQSDPAEEVGVASPVATTTTPNKWQLALAHYRDNKTPQKVTTPIIDDQSQSLVESRAEKFGGIKKGGGLRRTQSLRISTKTAPLKKPALY